MNQTLSISAFAMAVLAFGAAPSPVAAAVDPAAAAEGKSLYGNYCATCHGPGLKNTSGGVTFDLRKLKPDEHERFQNSVLNGKNQMPSWRGVLETDQIEDIWAYIRETNDR
jgi:mono/diheme cytochrome c family protein